MARNFAAVIADAIEPSLSVPESAVAFSEGADQAASAMVEMPQPSLQAAASPPVTQVLSFPMPLERALYTNARSGSNPNGDLLPLFRFRQLVDPVPGLGETYSPEPGSTERTYGEIINGAQVQPGNTFAANLFSDAQASFTQNVFPSLDGLPNSWRPIYSNPPNWCDVAAAPQFRSASVDLSDTALPELRIGKTATEARPMTLQQSSQVQSVSFRHLQVILVRPWLTYDLFSANGWSLNGQSTGFVSSGSSVTNSGVLPMLPTSLIIGSSPEVQADWSSADQDAIEGATSAGHFVSFGPFVLSAPTADTLFLVAVVNSVVPLSPRWAP